MSIVATMDNVTCNDCKSIIVGNKTVSLTEKSEVTVPTEWILLGENTTDADISMKTFLEEHPLQYDADSNELVCFKMEGDTAPTSGHTLRYAMISFVGTTGYKSMISVYRGAHNTQVAPSTLTGEAGMLSAINNSFLFTRGNGKFTAHENANVFVPVGGRLYYCKWKNFGNGVYGEV